jgi:hypothetical protein
MRPQVDQHGCVLASGMWVCDRGYSQLVLPSADVVNALLDQEQRRPHTASSNSPVKPARMPGLDAAAAPPATEAAVRQLCAALCAGGAHFDDGMSDGRMRQLRNNGASIVVSCLKFGAMAQVPPGARATLLSSPLLHLLHLPHLLNLLQANGDVASMLLWATRAHSLAEACLLNSSPIGLCVRVWSIDFKVCCCPREQHIRRRLMH